MNPYHEALKFIQEHPGTDSAAGMAKLILSLYNPIHAFGIGECLWSFDGERLNLAVRMVEHYAKHGEDQVLRDVGFEIWQTSPRLVELSDAASDAKTEVRNKWQAEEEASMPDIDAEWN